MNVSILMSVFNNEKTVGKAIKSILNQTFKNYELLIMDDCSNDNSYNICKEFEDNERVKVFKNKSNIGLTKSLNILAEQSNATYLARQDADDLSDLQRIEIQKTILEKNNYDIVTSRALIMDTKELRPKFSHLIPKNLILKYKNPFIHGSLFLKRQVFYEIGGYDEDYRYAQDYKFFIDAKLKGYKIFTIKKPLYYLNIKNNISNNFYKEQKYYSKKASAYYKKNK